MDSAYQLIDVPFHFRHVCWFCGEPSNQTLHFPIKRKDFIDCLHQPIALPSCAECLSLARQYYQRKDADGAVNSIWFCREKVKQSLVKRYQKDLAIGKNWTKEELANSEFEGGNFEGFARSAWFVFEVAQQRVNFTAWPLWCNGMAIEDIQAGKSFVFDGITFSDIDQAIDFYGKSYDLHLDFFKEVIQTVGIKRFAYAIRFCRLFVGSTPIERQRALRDLLLEHTSNETSL